MMYQQLMEMWTLLLDRYRSTRWWHCNHSLYYFVMQMISYKGHSTVIQQSVKEHHWKFGHIITCPIKNGMLHFADYKETLNASHFRQLLFNSWEHQTLLYPLPRSQVAWEWEYPFSGKERSTPNHRSTSASCDLSPQSRGSLYWHLCCKLHELWLPIAVVKPIPLQTSTLST